MSAAVVLDSSGRLRAAGGLWGTTPEALANAACAALNLLTGGEASVVSASVLGEPPRAFAMAMLREEPNGSFRSGTAAAEDRGDALVQAVLAALGFNDSVLATVAARWRALPDVMAASVVEGDSAATSVGVDDHADAHTRLVRAMPAPGLLAVTTEDTEYRVLRLADVALAVSAAPAAPAFEEIDEWMAKAEALAP
jgi:hypothetical protein